MLEVFEGLKHGSELARTEILVEAFGEAFEVNVGSVHVPKELDPRLWQNVARAHRHGLDLSLVAGLRHVDCIFEKDYRIVVGERNGPATALHCRFCDRLGRSQILHAIKIPDLGDVSVLAELAGQVAAGGAKRQDWAARQEVIERLLFDWIDAKT